MILNVVMISWRECLIKGLKQANKCWFGNLYRVHIPSYTCKPWAQMKNACFKLTCWSEQMWLGNCTFILHVYLTPILIKIKVILWYGTQILSHIVFYCKCCFLSNKETLNYAYEWRNEPWVFVCSKGNIICWSRKYSYPSHSRVWGGGGLSPPCIPSPLELLI